jgi:hypothetical protein
MKKIRNVLLIVCLSYAVFLGCDQFSNTVGPDQQRAMQSAGETGGFIAITDTTINNYNISASAGIYNGDLNITTFSYKVSYAGTGPSSNNFYLEIPECAVDAFRPDLLKSPSGKSIVYPYEDSRSKTTGVLWNASLSRQTANFSIVFDGNLRTGNISATVESGNRGATGEIAGPCKGNEVVEMFEVSGYVFVDVDENLVKNSYESGIWNVVVLLKGNGIKDIVTTTDFTGEFSIEAPAGQYTLLIPREIAGVEFNQKFFESYDYSDTDVNAADEPEKSLSLTADRTVDFPFLANTDALIEQFENKTILTNTRDAEFWRKMVQNAVNDSQGNFEVSKAEIYLLLNKIEKNQFFKTIDIDLLPEVPFQFKGETDIERAADALEYLFNPSSANKTPIQLFLRELLAAEFNIASGKYGVGGFEVEKNDPALCPGGTITPLGGKFYCDANIEEFHLALLAYGEGLAAQFIQLRAAGSQKVSTSTTSSTSLDDGTKVLSSFNRTGGGGLGF